MSNPNGLKRSPSTVTLAGVGSPPPFPGLASSANPIASGIGQAVASFAKSLGWSQPPPAAVVVEYRNTGQVVVFSRPRLAKLPFYGAIMAICGANQTVEAAVFFEEEGKPGSIRAKIDPDSWSDIVHHIVKIYVVSASPPGMGR